MISNDERLNLNRSDDDEINLSKFLSFLFRKKKILLFSIFLSTSIVGSLLNRATPSWQGGFQFILDTTDSDDFQNESENLISTLFKSRDSSSISNEISVIKSPIVLLPVYRDLIGSEDQPTKFKNIKSYKDYQKWRKSLEIEIIHGFKAL